MVCSLGRRRERKGKEDFPAFSIEIKEKKEEIKGRFAIALAS